MEVNPYKAPVERPPLVPIKPPLLDQLEDAIMTIGVRVAGFGAALFTGAVLALSTEALIHPVVAFLIGAIAGGFAGAMLARMVVKGVFRVINPKRKRAIRDPAA